MHFFEALRSAHAQPSAEWKRSLFFLTQGSERRSTLGYSSALPPALARGFTNTEDANFVGKPFLRLLDLHCHVLQALG